MSTWTMQLRELVKRFPDWIGDYPIFDESYRGELNKKIENHFWMREIGVEVPGDFMRLFNSKMNLIMPNLNLLYLSINKTFDPLANYVLEVTGKTATLGDVKNIAALVASGTSDITEAVRAAATMGETSKSAANTDTRVEAGSTGTNSARAAASQFPQTMLSNNGDYATSATDNTAVVKSDSTTKEWKQAHTSGSSNKESSDKSDSTHTGRSSDKRDSTASQKSSETTDRRVVTKGRITDPGQLLRSWMASAKSVDMMVMDELDPLFMGIFTSGHEYSTGYPPPYSHAYNHFNYYF